MVTEAVTAPAAVSGRTALIRAAVGTALALASGVLLGLLGRPLGRFLEPTIVIWAMLAVHSQRDHRHRPALLAGAAAAAGVWITVTHLLNGLPGDLAGTILGVVAGSQMYALVTHTGRAR